MEKHLPFEFINVHHEPDGNFPNGIPNSLLPENRSATIAAIHEHKADIGIAWDGDFDRCFLFDCQSLGVASISLASQAAQSVMRLF